MRKYTPMLLLFLLVLLAAGTSIRNGFVQDDLPIIERNKPLHSVSGALQATVKSYWPPPSDPALWRPMATTTYAAQWIAGGGSVLVFRVTSILLYFLVTLGVYLLALLVLPPTAAFFAAALFAVHPVHTEVVGISVNQAEMWACLISVTAVILYIRWRTTSRVTAPRGAALVALCFVALLFKESAIVLPALLVAVELTLFRADGTAWQRLRRLGPLLLGMAAAIVLFVACRTLVLAGDMVGTFTAEALYRLTTGQRGLTMLGVLPELTKLMLWPAHLQADYSPGEIIAATHWGLPQTVGALLLGGFLAVLALAWKRLPVAAFGLLWFALALAPVHNVLLPTGIVLAERTLFLPSAGFVIAVAAAIAVLLAPENAARVRRPLRHALVALMVAVLGLGAWRSSIRYRGFTNQLSFWYMTLKDAPLSYRANMAIADLIYDKKHPDPSRFFFLTAIDLFPSGGIARTLLADKYRFEGNCKEAAPLYQTVIDTFPKNSIARSSLVACLLWDGEYARARDVAETGITLKAEVPTYEQFVRTADSALAASAPPQSVRIRFDSAKVGMPAMEPDSANDPEAHPAP